MRSKSMVLLGLALGCGLVASIGISQVMDRRGSAEASGGEMEPILVASKDVHYNDELTPDNIGIQEWPKGKVPPGAVTTLDEIRGRRSAAKLFAGEPVLTGKLMGADGMGAARKIPQGYRVVTVRVDEVAGASSLIKIDDRVDVLAFLTRNTKNGEERSARTILQDVRVFAVDSQFERQHSGDSNAPAAKTVSLLLTQEQALKVTLASEMGKIRLVMRSPDDSEQAESSGASVGDIFGESTANGAVATDPIVPGAEFGLTGPPRQPPSAASGAAGGVGAGGVGAGVGFAADGTPLGSAPAPAPIPMTKQPEVFTMVVVEGSEMREFKLSANSQFAPIISEHIDYQPDPPPPPVQPQLPADAVSPPDGPTTLEQPTAIDDGLGDETEVPNL